ncbi:MAG: class III cytochrome C [Desulfuromonas sp.]|nr:MAG: class III cytochrome C [Desulfuromonas sp.]
MDNSRMKKIILKALAVAAIWFVPLSLWAMETPESVDLNVDGEYFSVVMFDHSMHEEIGECDACHHHTTGGGTTDSNCAECHADSHAAATVACSDCHAQEPFSAETLQAKSSSTYQYHLDTPGLKGALHQNCLGCHEQQDGPVGCQDCHERTPQGDLFYAGSLGKE